MSKFNGSLAFLGRMYVLWLGNSDQSGADSTAQALIFIFIFTSASIRVVDDLWIHMSVEMDSMSCQTNEGYADVLPNR